LAKEKRWHGAGRKEDSAYGHIMARCGNWPPVATKHSSCTNKGCACKGFMASITSLRHTHSSPVGTFSRPNPKMSAMASGGACKHKIGQRVSVSNVRFWGAEPSARGKERVPTVHTQTTTFFAVADSQVNLHELKLHGPDVTAAQPKTGGRRGVVREGGRKEEGWRGGRL
jgi:hypothetical protein